jgi:hypothetical protein
LLDSKLGEGVVKDIPIVVSLAKIGRRVRAFVIYLFSKKLCVFLRTLSSVSPAQRKEMIAKLETDPHFGSTVGESVILLLDRLDLVSKAELAGRGFCAYCLGVIDATTLDRINFALDRILMRDLTHLPRVCEKPRGDGQGDYAVGRKRGASLLPDGIGID